MALSQELVKQCRPSQETCTRTSQDEVDDHNHTSTRRQSINTIGTLNQARSSKHISMRMSTSHCSVENKLCKRIPRSQQCTMHDCGPQNAGLRRRTVTSATCQWTTRGLDAWYSLRDPPLLESAWRQKRQIPQALFEYCDSSCSNNTDASVEGKRCYCNEEILHPKRE